MGCYFGVDPGKKGAFALVDENGYFVEAVPIPTMRSHEKNREVYDFDSIEALFKNYAPILEGAAVEGQHPFPSQMGGAIANFSRGESLAFEWLLRSMGIPVIRPYPIRWQKVCLTEPGIETGDRSIATALVRWPGVNLRRTARSTKNDDGISDALHLAWYAREHFQGRLK